MIHELHSLPHNQPTLLCDTKTTTIDQEVLVVVNFETHKDEYAFDVACWMEMINNVISSSGNSPKYTKENLIDLIKLNEFTGCRLRWVLSGNRLFVV
ncbi:hypothetical protein LXL04_035278 [Taraxacum kok-saghyz]